MAIAEALQAEIQTFARPWYRPRILRVFRDETNLAAAPELWPEIEHALSESKWLILMASPHAARSLWVRKEVEWWLANRPADRILIAWTSGRLLWDDGARDFLWTTDENGTDALPAELAGVFTSVPRWIDLRHLNGTFGAERAGQRTHGRTRRRGLQLGDLVAEFAAPILGMAKDELVGEHIKQRRRTRRTIQGVIAGLTALALFASAAAAVAVVQRQDALLRLDIATSRQLAADAGLKLNSDPQLSALLSLAAFTVHDTPEARAALLSELQYFQDQGIDRFITTQLTDVKRVAFSPDGRTLAVSNMHNDVELWDTATYSRTAVLSGKVAGYLAEENGLQLSGLAFSPDGRILAAASTDHSDVILWDVARRTKLATLFIEESGSDPDPGITSISFSPDGRLLAVGTGRKYHNEVILWDVASRKIIGRLSGHANGVSSVAFSPDGQTLASGGFDSVILWNVKRLAKVGTLKATFVNGLSFSPDGHVLAVGSEFGLTLWNVADSRLLGSLSPATGITSVAFSPDGSELVSGGHSGKAGFGLHGTGAANVTLWDVARRRQIFSFAGHSGPVNSVAFSPNGQLIASGADDGNAILWQVAREDRLRSVLPSNTRGSGQAVRGVAFTPDGRILVAPAAEPGEVNLWNVSHRTLITTLPISSDELTGIAVSHDGREIAASTGTEVSLWSLTQRSYISSLDDIGDVFAFSPDDQRLAVGLSVMDLWNVAGGAGYSTVPCPLYYSDSSLAFSPDGGIIAACTNSNIILWDARRLTKVATLSGGANAEVSALQFSPDGRTLAVGDFDGTISLWDVAQRRQLALLSGHTGSVSDLEFSPDGRMLASGSDNEVILWDVNSPTQIGTFPNKVVRTSQIAFSPDNRVLAVDDDDGNVYLWDVDVTSWRRQLCGVLGRDLTREEFATYLPNYSYHPMCTADAA